MAILTDNNVDIFENGMSLVTTTGTEKVISYTFHDPPMAGRKLPRGTTFAFLTENGLLFIGASVCCEGDQFSRKFGRSRAAQKADEKLTAWATAAKGSVPDDILNLEGMGPKEVNNAVRQCCDLYLLETFRKMLAARANIINGLPAWK